MTSIANSERLEYLRTLGVTAIVAGPNTGKSTILRAFKKAKAHVTGFVIEDMSDIISWNRDPKNESPFREEFERGIELQKMGRLLPDELTLNGLFYYLVQVRQSLHGQENDIRHIILSGVPRNQNQGMILGIAFPRMRMFHIDCNENEADKLRLQRIADGEKRPEDDPEIFKDRWKDVPSTINPLVSWFKENHSKERFACVCHSRKPLVRALMLLRLMDITATEAASLKSQLTKRGCTAFEYLREVGKKRGTGTARSCEIVSNGDANPTRAYQRVFGVQSSAHAM